MMERIPVMGVGFDNVTIEEAAALCRLFLLGDRARTVVTPNSEIVQRCIENPLVCDTINSADLVIPDGIGVVYASKILGSPLKERVAGIDLAAALLPILEEEKKGLFLLGARPGVAQRAGEELKKKHPRLLIKGVCDGYFDDEGTVVDQINKSGADALFVCLGAPKQELFMTRHKEELKVRLMAGLGGCLDVWAGDVKRAPDIFIRLGLEWFYRLIKEPYRIGRMMKLPLFLLGAINCRLFKGRNTDE